MKRLSRPRIALFFLGGSVIDQRGRRGDSVTREADVEPWMENMSETDIIAETEGFFVSSGTAVIGVQDWVRLGTLIAANYKKFDGFVVIHQLETLPSAATALSLMLHRLEKPVVLVGSALRVKRDRTAGTMFMEYGAKESFVNAVQVAVSDIAEVVVVSGSNILRGPTVKVNDGHTAFVGQILGKIDFGTRLWKEQVRRAPRAFKLRPVFDRNVVAVEYMPGLEAAAIARLVGSNHGVLVSAGEAAALQLFLPDLVRRLGRDVRVGVFVPATGSLHWPSGVIPLAGPSRSSALLQLMWGLGQTRQVGTLRTLLGAT